MKYRIVLTTAITILALALTACYEQSLTSDEYNQPSPFSPTTSISFAVPDCRPVRIDVYNVQGELVGTPFDTIACDAIKVDLRTPIVRINDVTQAADTVWRGINGLPAGIYFYSLVTPTDTITKKMVFVK